MAVRNCELISTQLASGGLSSLAGFTDATSNAYDCASSDVAPRVANASAHMRRLAMRSSGGILVGVIQASYVPID
jgi:hypothetical protein